MIGWCAILIPIYPPHYEYAYRFIDRIANTFPLFFVFSSEEDIQSFQMKDSVNILLLPPTSPQGTINKKKIFGLHYLKTSSYEYIIVMDAETDFIHDSFSENRFKQTIECLFEQKIFFGMNIEHHNEMKTMGFVMKSSISIFPSEVWTTLLEETNNLTVYTWWSDLPVYKRDTLENFLSYIPFENLQWEHFDHLLYTYYLVAYHGFHIKDVSFFLQSDKPIDSLPCASETELLSLQNEGLSFLYINFALYNSNLNFFKKLGTVFISHLDRKHLENTTKS